MTQLPEEQPSAPEQASTAPTPRAWYAHPWLWSLFFLLLILGILGFVIWKQFQLAQMAEAAQQQLLLQLTERTAQLDAEKKRLQELLALDPCTIQDILRQHPLEGAGTPLMIPSNNATTQVEPMQADTPAQPAPTIPTTPTSLNGRLEQATVLLLTPAPNGLHMGTGFFVTPDTIVTNRHVVGGQMGTSYVVGKGAGLLQGRVTHVSNEKNRDYALVSVPKTAVTPLRINTHVVRTDKVSAWGYPNTITKDDPKFQDLLKGKGITAPEVVYSEGNVSVVLQRTPPLIVHSAVVSQGNSGGPLVNTKGDVVGINTYIKLDDASYRQSSLAIAASDLATYLQSQGIAFTAASAKE